MTTPKTKEEKAFNATKEGQFAMYDDSRKRGFVLYLNNQVAAKGGSSWSAAIIDDANDNLLAAIRSDLINEWNNIVRKS